MNNQIEVLKRTELCGQQFEVYGTPQEPLFKAKDVALTLGLSNHREFINRVDEEERSKLNLPRQGETWMLTENGLYEVLMQSRKPIAKQFKRGVKAILKEIRQTGGYISSHQSDSPELIMARALQVAQSTIERHKQQLEAAKAQLQDQAQKVAFADALIASKTSCLIGELAKLITQNGVVIGQNRLFQWLRDYHYLGKSGEHRNIPHQKYIEQGLFELKKGVRSGLDGVIHTTITPKVTPKGQSYFINKFLSQGQSSQVV